MGKCECMFKSICECLHIFLFSKFWALTILFFKLKKTQPRNLSFSSYKAPSSNSFTSPHLNALKHLFANDCVRLVTTHSSVIPALPKPFSPEGPQLPHQGPFGAHSHLAWEMPPTVQHGAGRSHLTLGGPKRCFMP